jgi:hypothetical protein
LIVNTFKVIMVPLAVLLLALAIVLPPGAPGSPRASSWPRVRLILAGVATILAAIALFIAADNAP